MNIFLIVLVVAIAVPAIYFIALWLIEFSVRDLKIKYSKEDKRKVSAGVK